MKGDDTVRYSLRLILLPEEAIGSSSVRPAADREIARFDAPPDLAQRCLEQIHRGLTEPIRRLLQEGGRAEWSET